MSRPRREAWSIAAGLTGLLLVLFRGPVFGGRTLYERDIHLIWIAQVEGFVRSVASGSLPLWDPTVCFGQPLLADPSSQVLYPFTWLNLILPLHAYYTLFVISHLLLAALGVCRLTRRMGVSAAGGAVAAVIWALSGPLLSLVNVWHHFAGACWIPWMLAAAHDSVDAPEARHALRWGMVAALQILAGSADMCVMSGLLSVAYVLTRRPWTRDGSGRRWLGAASGAAALALALTAAQWMPTLDTASRSQRWHLPEANRNAWSVHPVAVSETLLPLSLHELPLRAEYRQSLFDSREPFLLSLYLGLVTSGLVVAALVCGGPERFFWGGVGLASLLVALGRHAPFYATAIFLLPPLRILRYPSKAMIVVALVWAVLAGLGFDAWQRGVDATAARRRFLYAWLGLGVALSAIAAFAAGSSGEDWRGRFLEAGAGEPSAHAALVPLLRRLTVVALLALVALVVTLRAGSRRGSIALAVLAVLDLLIVHDRLNPSVARELFRFRPPTVSALHEDAVRRGGGPSRVYIYEYTLVDGKARHLRHESPEVTRSLQQDPYLVRVESQSWPLSLVRALAQQAYLFPPLPGRWGLVSAYDIDLRGLYPDYLVAFTRFLRDVEGTPAHRRLLEMGGVTHVIALHAETFADLTPMTTFPAPFVMPLHVFRVPDPMPRTYVAAGARVADGAAALSILADSAFDPRREVIVPSGEARPALSSSPGTTRLVEARPDRVRIQAELDRPGYVVLLDSYDPGWTATIDGAPAPVLRANVAFRAVDVPAGAHVIEYRYRPKSFRAGALISMAALVTAAALAVVRGR